METILQALLLGVVEGLTEFLPVSSTGHLVLLIDLLGFRGPPGKVFEIVIQLGAILAVCWVYRVRLGAAVVHAAGRPEARRFLRNILIGFVPSMVIGAVAYKTIKTVLLTPWVVSAMLVLGGIAILVIERLVRQPRHHAVEELPLTVSLRIGLFQCLAMIPGVSRSGATIMGSLLMGVDRKAAAEFSFFLAIPTMLAASAYDLYKNWAVLDFSGAAVIAAGFLSAFLVAMLVVRAAIGFVSRHGFAVFAWYRIALGLVMLGILMAR